MTRTPTAHRWVTLVLVAVAAAGLGALVAAATRHFATAGSDGTAGVTRSVHTFRHPRVLTPADAPAVLNQVPVTTHGSTVRVDWLAGSLSPEGPSTRTSIALTVDGRAVATTTVDGETGIHEGQIPEIVWAARLRPGRHLVAVTLESTTQPVALPDAIGGRPAQDSLTVTEFSGP